MNTNAFLLRKYYRIVIKVGFRDDDDKIHACTVDKKIRFKKSRRCQTKKNENIGNLGYAYKCLFIGENKMKFCILKGITY